MLLVFINLLSFIYSPPSSKFESFGRSKKSKEEQLKEIYESKIAYLMLQVDTCDEKAVEFRIEWQNSLLELEQCSARERQLLLELNQSKQLLNDTHDELETVRRNYDSQIKILSDHVLRLSERIPEGGEEQKNSKK